MSEILRSILHWLAIFGYVFFSFVVIYRWLHRKREEELREMKKYIDESNQEMKNFIRDTVRPNE
ncbi:MAG: hypothetical protein KDK45_00120 [Leptospiraceae bacterium]|nr:hypothetical protein [Leptospiraceae bacterium]